MYPCWADFNPIVHSLVIYVPKPATTHTNAPNHLLVDNIVRLQSLKISYCKVDAVSEYPAFILPGTCLRVPALSSYIIVLLPDKRRLVRTEDITAAGGKQ